MITLTLLHPIQSIPVQHWTFEHDPVIRIGRSTDNHVILYSAVVSRYHCELRCVNSQWEVVSLGANGTYVDGKRITQMPIKDSIVIRLARSGPNIQIHVGTLPADTAKTLQGEPLSSQAKASLGGIVTADAGEPTASGEEPIANLDIPVTRQPEEDEPAPSGALAQRLPASGAENGLSGARSQAIDPMSCTHPRAHGNVLFCPDCGQPLQVVQTVGDYQIVKTVRQDAIGITQLAWRNGQSLVLRTLKPACQQPEIVEAFTQQAKQLLALEHPGLPDFIDFFLVEGKPYLVRRRVYGQSLQQRVSQRGALTQAEAIAAIVQMCSTLDYLHQQSLPLVHEDLKPENLIQNATATAINTTIVGLVSLKSLVIDEQTTTSPYMAPEQKQGQKTIAVDLFALGPILVYLLTGEAPGVFYAQQEQGLRFYPESIPGLAIELAAIVRRLTSPQPDERYASAGKLAEALLGVSTTV